MKPIRLLLVEGYLTDQLSFKRFVKTQALPYDYDISSSVAEATNFISKNTYDIIIADHALGDGTAFDLFKHVLLKTPIIIVTGNGSEDIAARALKKGASDYLTKDIEGKYLQLLPHIIQHVLKTKADERELENFRYHLETIVHERTEALQKEIKQRKAVERQLRLLAVAFETHEAVVITDASGDILRVNKAFENLTEYTSEEVLGKNMRILNSGLQDSEFYINMWEKIIEIGRFDGEMWNRRKSGTTFLEKLTITAITDDNGCITHYVGNLADITEQKKAEDQIKKLAFYDSLTGLANRRLLLDRIEHECAIAKRHGFYGAVIFIDLDDFKPINDTYGHDVGDELLIHVATLLCSTLREDDTASRFGGDEFIVLIHASDISFDTAVSNAMVVSEKIQTALNKSYSFQGQELSFTASIGIAIFPKHANNSDNSDNIINKADQAMYLSKKQGGNSINIY